MVGWVDGRIGLSGCIGVCGRKRKQMGGWVGGRAGKRVDMWASERASERLLHLAFRQCVGTCADVCIHLPIIGFKALAAVDPSSKMAASGADVLGTGADVLLRIRPTVGTLTGTAVGAAVGDLSC